MWYTEADEITHVPRERSASCLTVTMITRFNAEYKERANGKGKFTGKERLEIGSASMMGIPYRIAGERFDISRTHYHELGKEADCALENVCASEQATERALALRKHRIIGQKRAADIRQRKMTVSMLIVSVLWHDNQAAKPRLPAR